VLRNGWETSLREDITVVKCAISALETVTGDALNARGVQYSLGFTHVMVAAYGLRVIHSQTISGILPVQCWANTVEQILYCNHSSWGRSAEQHSIS